MAGGRTGKAGNRRGPGGEGGRGRGRPRGPLSLCHKEELMAGGRTGEAGNRRGRGGEGGRGRGRPRGPLSKEEQKEERIIKNREYRAKRTFEHTEFEAFCEMPGIKDMFKAFSEEYRKRNEESSKMESLLKKYEGFCMEPRIIDKFKAISEKCRKRIEECTKKWQELFEKFFEEGIIEKFQAVCLKAKEEEERKFNEEFKKLCEVWENLEIEMLQMGGLEGVTAMNLSSLEDLEMIQMGGVDGVTAVNSSSFGAMGTPFEPEGGLKRRREEELDGPHRNKRPATAYTTPSRPPVGGFMADARQNYCQSAAALATQGSLFSTNKGTEIQTREAAHDDKEASTSSWAPLQVELKTFTDDELGQWSINELSFSDLLEAGTYEFLDPDTFLNLWDLEVSTGNLAGSSNVSSNWEVELQSRTTCTAPLTAGAMNSTATGEPHHDPIALRGGTAAVGSSGGPTTQSSLHNEKF